MIRSWLFKSGWMVSAVVGIPLVWFAYLLAVPEANAEFQMGRFHELTSWVNISLMPLLGFLALAIYLVTGQAVAKGLALAALSFAAIFPLNRLFTADFNFPASFQFYETLGRAVFVGWALVIVVPQRMSPPVHRRRSIILILMVAGFLAVLRYLMKEILDEIAGDPQGFFKEVQKKIELAVMFISVGVALRLGWRRGNDQRKAPALALAFILVAEEALFFLFSQPPDLFWWSANVLWGLATLLMIGAVLNLAAEAGRLSPGLELVGELPKGTILGPYEILERVGEGGMGKVYKARHRVLKRVVAIKVIRPQQLVNPTTLQRFHREALAAAHLDHANIVPLLDASEENGTHFLVMEYVEGCDLAELVEEKGHLPVPVACDYIRQAAQGLQHAHERGLVHRDIKPANFLVTADGSLVKIMDLGVARFLQPDEQDLPMKELTVTGAVMGTPAYLAPEQARDSRQADIRSDIYSLGCTFYHLLAGAPPFHGVSLAELILCHQFEDPAPIDQKRPDVPAELAKILRKMMAKKPEDRYQTPAEVAEAVRPLIGLEGSG